MPQAEATLPTTYLQPQAYTGTIGAARQQWLFCSVCFYLLSQAYQIPVLAIGPSWALWPRFTDAAIAMAAVGLLPGLMRGFPLARPHRQILFWLLVFLWVATLSVVVSTMILPRLSSYFPTYPGALQWGAYHLLRMVQFVIVFCAAAVIRLTAQRKQWLVWLTSVVLVVLCVSIIANYFGILSHAALTAHLPQDKDVAGPWAQFGEDGDGLGTVGYNHAYPACQVMMAYALFFYLTDRRLTLFSGALLLLTLLATLLSGSRAGFGAMLLFVGVCLYLWIQRGHLVSLVLIATVLAGAGMLYLALPGGIVNPLTQEVVSEHDSVLTRQATTFSGYRSENLSGRTEIWMSRLKYLNDEPYRWIFGAGFGTAPTSGYNAHMQALNVVVELGVVGLLVGLGLSAAMGVHLWRLEATGRPFFWSVAAIATTCLTQETFYPVPALGHFFGFFLFCVAIVLRDRLDSIPFEQATREER